MLVKCVLGPRLRGGKHEHRQLDATIERRMDRWEDGDLLGLWAEIVVKAPPVKEPTVKDSIVGAIRLVREGQYSRGFARLTSSGVQKASATVLATLRRLHPVADPPAMPQCEGPAPRAPTVTADMVRDALASFDAMTAPGAMGLKVPHLTDLVASDPSGAFVDALTRVVQRLADGTLCVEARPFVCGACLTALPKPDGGTRPIAAGEILRRLTSKVMIGAVRARLDAHFLPYQYGVGSRGGAERIVHRVRAAVALNTATDDFVLLKVDLQNAFNRVSREAVLAAVAADFPCLLPWVSCLYGTHSVLWFGQEKISSECGVQQGDPLGPLLFSLVVHRLILRIAETTGLSANLWYLDDGVLAGPHAEVHKACQLLESEGPALGLHLNAAKCELVWLGRIPANHGFPAAFAEKKRHLDNFELLGAPIGDAEHTRRFVEATVLEKARASWSVLALLENDAQVVYSLLRQCCSANRIGHLLRSVPPSLLAASTATFDREFRAAFGGLLHLNLSEQQWWQASLPTRLGGLGLSSASAHRKPAYVASVSFACATDRWSRQYAAEFYPAVDDLLLMSGAPPLPTPEANELVHLCNFIKCAKPGLPSQGELSAIVHATTTRSLEEGASVYRIAKLRAVAEQGAGCWLNVVPSTVLRLAIPSAEFSTLLRWWLGADLFATRQMCPLCGVPMDTEGQHALVCRNGGFFGVRHHALRDVFFHAMKSAAMNPGLEVPNLLEGSNDRPADVMWDNVCGDVCVTHPLQPKYVALTAARAQSEPGAAQERYAVDVKLRKYATRCEAAGLEIHPLVASAFGAWGDKGRALIHTIAQRVSARTGVPAGICATQLHQRLSVVLLRSNAKAILSRTAADAPSIFLDALDTEDPEVFDPSTEATNFFSPVFPEEPARATAAARPSTSTATARSSVSAPVRELPCAPGTTSIASVASEAVEEEEEEEEMFDCREGRSE